MSALDKILPEPGIVLATLGAEWAKLRNLCTDKNRSGNDLPDAWLAEATSYVGEHLVTFDRDSKKLPPRSYVTVLPAPNS